MKRCSLTLNHNYIRVILPYTEKKKKRLTMDSRFPFLQEPLWMELTKSKRSSPLCKKKTSVFLLQIRAVKT